MTYGDKVLSVLPYSNGVGFAFGYSHLLRGVEDNMNLRIYSAIVVGFVVYSLLLGNVAYYNGRKDGKALLLTEQRDAATALQAKQTTRQQANGTKAAAADSQGAAKTVTITQEVIKYVKTPGRDVCEFPPERVRLKSRAVDNANSIPGFDDAAVQATPAGK